MLRRPLAPNPRDEDLWVSPCDRFGELLGSFRTQATRMPPYMEHAADPLKTFDTPQDVARAVGLKDLPQGWAHRYPLRPIDTQHPTAFLQWGWLTNGHKQIHFEIGDGGYLISLHFIKAIPGNNNTSWHLGYIEINDGKAETYTLNCSHPTGDEVYDMPDHSSHIEHLMDAVRMATTILCRDNWESATQILHDAVRPIIEDLNSFSDAAAAEHASSWISSQGSAQSTGRVPVTKFRS